MLVGLSVLVALTLSFVSNNGLNIIKAQVDELIRANNIERSTYRAILEEKNYLLNANGSVTNHEMARHAFSNADKALKAIDTTLNEIEQKSPDPDVLQTTEAVRKAIDEYGVFYKRGVYLLDELENARQILQKEGDKITLQIQQYVEAKRVDVKQALSQETIEKINCGSNIWQYTYVTRADEKRYLLSPDDALYEQLKKDYAFMMSELDRLKGISDQPFEQEKIAVFYQSARNYEEAMHNWVRYNKEHVSTILPKTKELGDVVISEALKIANMAVDDIAKKRTIVVTTLITVTLLAILLGILFGGVVSRSISSIILNFQTGLLDFFKYLDRQKNSANQIKIESKDEIALMAEVVNENILKIEEVMEKKLSQMKEKDQQMLKQSRLAQMGEMISMIAHQWRQPLGAISATTSDMEVKLFQRRMYDLSTEQGQADMEAYTVENIHRINGFVKHLSTTIDDFRNFFKSDKAVSAFRLSELMDKTLNLTGHLLRTKGIEVTKDFDPTLEDIKSYENEIMQVFLNIIHNAVDILTEKRIETPEIYITIEKNRMGHQTVLIEDNAGGIPTDLIDKIFEPYFSTKDINGTGLGLYMSQTIIEEHCQGVMRVKNTARGACFSIEFPDMMDGSNEV